MLRQICELMSLYFFNSFNSQSTLLLWRNIILKGKWIIIPLTKIKSSCNLKYDNMIIWREHIMYSFVGKQYFKYALLWNFSVKLFWKIWYCSQEKTYDGVLIEFNCSYIIVNSFQNFSEQLFYRKPVIGYFCRNCHRRCSLRKPLLKNHKKFTAKHLCWSHFLIKLQSFKPTALSKRDFNTVFCSKFLRNFWKHFF